MDVLTMMMMLTRAELTAAQILMFIVMYMLYYHRYEMKQWVGHYEHHWMTPRSQKMMVFRFQTSVILNAMYAIFDDEECQLGITAEAQAIVWMFLRDAGCQAKIQETLGVTSKNWKVFDGLPKEPKTVNLPIDVHKYELANGLVVSFTYCTKKIDGSNENHKETQEVLQWEIKVISRKLSHSELQATVAENFKKYQEWLHEQTRGKRFIYYFHKAAVSKESEWLYYNFDSTKSFDNMFFEGKKELLDRLESYEKDEAMYKRLGIPHSLGLLLHGEPGCGKTSVIKAIANHTKRSIVNINMKDYDNVDDLRKLFMSNKVCPYVNTARNERIYVFEEIDCAVDDLESNPFLCREYVEKNKKEKSGADVLTQVLKAACEGDEKKAGPTSPLKIQSKITTGEILELLDGISESDDRIIIFTTNYPELLDKAFMRPGRIDMCMNFKKLRRTDVDDLYHLWFGRRIKKVDLDRLKDYTVTQAEMGKLCFQHKKHPESIVEELLKM